MYLKKKTQKATLIFFSLQKDSDSVPVGSVPDPRLAPSSTSLNGGTWLFSPTPVFIPNFSSTRGGATSSVKLPAAGSVEYGKYRTGEKEKNWYTGIAQKIKFFQLDIWGETILCLIEYKAV